ncbi:MAG: efflux RND transporter periplasmic adaptor subunit [Candidatus Binataceae bacterium]|nr:efflux RND transporter periplasmic adaptor subunit [Candidatus Binataceae bacterium]
MKRAGLMVGLAALFLIAAAASGAAQPLPGDGMVRVNLDSDAARRIELATVHREKIAGRIDATATIEPDARAVDQITTRIPARVMRLIADPGEAVKAGQPLAILSSVELGQAKTRYLRARSLHVIAEQHLKREEALYAKKITPLKDLLAARADRDAALAEYQAARETLRVLIPADQLRSLSWSDNRTPLSDFPLTSQISGILVRRNLTVGQSVDRDRPLMTVIDLDQVWVITNVFEHDLGGLRLNAKAWVTVDAYPGRRFEGRIFYIGDEVDRQTRTVEARIKVPNPERLLKPGMFAHAEVADNSSGREVIAAPRSAIFEIDGKKIAFVALGPGRFQARYLKLGINGDQHVEILNGLNEGDRVVDRGGLALKALLLNRQSS